MSQDDEDDSIGSEILARVEACISEGSPVSAADAKLLLRVALVNIERTHRAEAIMELTNELTGRMQYEVCKSCKHYRSQFEAGSSGEKR